MPTTEEIVTNQLIRIREFSKIGIRAGFNEGDKWRAVCPNAIVFHLGAILDSPLGDNKMAYSALSKFKKSQGWLLSESPLIEFNEKRFCLSVILIFNYLINKGHEITQKAPHEPINIVFHVHRGEQSASAVFKKVIKLISECCSAQFIEGMDEKNLPNLKSNLINISFRFGAFKAVSEPVYEQADILFSHSLLIGLDPTLKPGDLIIPDKLSAMDIDEFSLDLQRSPIKKNMLIEKLPEILEQSQEQFIEILNTDRKKFFKSENPKKIHDKAEPLELKHFQSIHVAVLSGLLDIKDPEQLVRRRLVDKDNKLRYSTAVIALTKGRQGIFPVPKNQLHVQQISQQFVSVRSKL